MQLLIKVVILASVSQSASMICPPGVNPVCINRSTGEILVTTEKCPNGLSRECLSAESLINGVDEMNGTIINVLSANISIDDNVDKITFGDIIVLITMISTIVTLYWLCYIYHRAEEYDEPLIDNSY